MVLLKRSKFKSGSPKLPSVWRLLWGSLSSYRHHYKPIIVISAAVALPYGLAGLTAGPNNETVIAYSSLAAMVMNLALIWSIIQLEQGKSVGIKTAYYQGTSRLVKFFLLTVVLILQLIPLVIGAVFYSAATVGTVTAVSIPEQMLVGLLWFILAVPSFYLLTRSSLAVFALNDSDLTPITALRRSWVMVKGQSWAVFGRLLFVGTFVMLITLLPTIVVLSLMSPKIIPFGLALLQLLVSLAVVPIAYFYLHKLYRSLI